MKLNKKLAILGVGLTASTGALAQTFYQCLPCPAGTYSKDGQCKQCERDYYCPSGSKPIACPSGTYSYPGSSVCCPSGYYGGNTKCFRMSDLKDENFTEINGQASNGCRIGTLQPGWYLVKLEGGRSRGACWAASKSGAELRYVFFVPSTASYQICAGSDGDYCVGEADNGCWTPKCHGASGGGGGSWLKLNFGGKDYYFVAGGARGFDIGENGTGNDNPDEIKGGAGSGGGIGGGGGGAATLKYNGSKGGSSGPYAGGTGGTISNGETFGGRGGQGLTNGHNGSSNKSYHAGGGGSGGGGSYSGTTTSSYFFGLTIAGGRASDAVTINIINGYKTTSRITKRFGGGDGNSASASHEDNAPNISRPYGSTAKLYKLNI